MEEITFEYKFVDESERSRIGLEFSHSDDEALRFGVLDDGQFYVSANRTGFLALAKLCIKLASGTYRNGFHLHLGQDFGDSNAQPNMIVSVMGEAEQSASD